VEQRLDLQVDKQEIYDTLMRYCRGIDRCDAELASSTFISASAPGPRGWRKQSDVIAVLRETCKLSMHFVGNVLIEVEGDTATSESYLFSYQIIDRDQGEYVRTRAVRYLHWWARTTEGWRISGRQVIDDWNDLREIRDAPGSETWAYGTRTRNDPVYHMKDAATT
jgi:hypothetical protein